MSSTFIIKSSKAPVLKYIVLELFVGPLSGSLVKTLGHRHTTQLGAAIGSAGLVLTAFAPNITVICISFGVVTGK